jgi:thiol-disulfide isomerase/thioredoxin
MPNLAPGWPQTQAVTDHARVKGREHPAKRSFSAADAAKGFRLELWRHAMRIAGVALALLMLGGTAQAAPAPKLQIAALAQLPTPLPYPYDEKADAGKAVAAARARAEAGGKLLLIDLGGNWCPDCRILAGVMALPQMKPFLNRHYVMVSVDVGRFDRNLQIPAHYGITKRLEGVPSVLIVDPKSDRLLNSGHVSALADARSMTPQALADWLAQWTK